MPEPETDLEIDVDIDDADSAAMAAMMGFSSFGSQAHPNKKRRFNPLADAVIDSPWDNRPPAATGARAGHNARPPTTSANSVPVGAPRAPMSLPQPSSTLPPKPVASISNISSLPLLPATSKSNTDEIDLDDDGNTDNGQDGENGRNGENGDAEPGPQYIDTSRPIGEVRDHRLGINDHIGEPRQGEDEAAFHARMQAVIATGNSQYAVTGTGTGTGTETGGALAPPNPQQLDGSVLSTGQFGHRPEGGRLKDRHGFRPDLAPDRSRGADALNENTLSGVDGEMVDTHADSEPQQRDWWTGYYDPQSNENPWLQMESKLELPSRQGCWLETGHYKGHFGPGNGGNYRGRGGGGGGGGGRGGFRGRGNSQNRGRGPRRY